MAAPDLENMSFTFQANLASFVPPRKVSTAEGLCISEL
jgi:hypothetical protein